MEYEITRGFVLWSILKAVFCNLVYKLSKHFAVFADSIRRLLLFIWNHLLFLCFFTIAQRPFLLHPVFALWAFRTSSSG